MLLTYVKPVAFEFFSEIVCGGDCPLGCIAVAVRSLSSKGGRPLVDVFVAQFLSVWAQVETL